MINRSTAVTMTIMIVRRLFVLFALSYVNFGCSAQRMLNLYEGEVCRKGDGKNSPDYVCRRFSNCTTAMQGIKKNISPKICSFEGSTPIVCCQPTPKVTTSSNTITTEKPRPPATLKTYSAAEMCREYSDLIYKYIPDPTLTSNNNRFIKQKDCLDAKTLIVGGKKAEPKEFPHMVLLGYDETVKYNTWPCGGSLISNKWILTAAHCEKSGSSYARWARLGELNYLIDTDVAKPKDYKIAQRILHPKYRPPSLYNDVALFRLEENVEFSAFVRPICLNADQSLKPSTLVATGWGQIETGGPFSPDLLKVTLASVSIKSCNNANSGNVRQLPNGIIEDSMICAGYPEGGRDTCGGDSGGPIQIVHSNYTCMYTQIGITSFGQFCAEINSPGVYTRVSNYVPWIEQIVWPKQ